MSRKIKLNDGTDFTLSDAIDNIIQSGVVNLTDSQGVFFQRELEAREAQSYDVLYPDLEARECFVTNSFGGAGATSSTYKSFDYVGKAQVINARATDLPKPDITGTEHTTYFKSVGVAYDYDVDEIAHAEMAGMPLEARKIMAARRGYEEFINNVAWNGDKGAGLKGFFQRDGAGDSIHQIVDHAVPAGVSTNTEWETKTPDEVLADLNGAVNGMYAYTLKVFRPKQLMMSVAKWNYLNSTPRSPVSDTTILQYFLNNNQFITDRSQIKELNSVVAQGKNGTEVLVVLTHTSPEGMETVRLRETLPLTYLPVQLHGLVYEIPGRGRYGGIEVTYPDAINFWYGI
jgi:hypothetical protein